MNHHLNTLIFKNPPNRFYIHIVASDPIQQMSNAPRVRGGAFEHRHMVTLIQEGLQQMTTQKAGGPGEEDCFSHFFSQLPELFAP